MLVEKGLARDRKEALALLLSGRVYVDDQKEDKAGTLVNPSSAITLKSLKKFSSRGGYKLEAALKALQIDVTGFACMDLGASTGGFTDCLLHYGARCVYAFDVGQGQLDWKLRQDPRVIVHEGVNVRFLDRSRVEERIDLITGDLSFISIGLVLPALKCFFEAQVLLLVKPQFEARPEEVEAGGLVRDERKRLEILERTRTLVRNQGFQIEGEVTSPIRGRKGNLEHFLLLKTQG